MSIATYDDLAAATRLQAAWAAQVPAAGSAIEVWTLAGTPPTSAATPGTAYTNHSSALMTFPDLSPIEKFLVEFESSCPSSSGQLVWLMDRLVGVGQSIVGTGDKTINSTALPRYTTGEDVMVFLEVTTITATTLPVISLASYTNQAGASGRAGASLSWPSAVQEVNSWIGPMPLQSGDSGVRSVETINVSAAPSAGVVNVVLAKPLIFSGHAAGPSVGLPIGVTAMDYVFPRRIYDGATLVCIYKGNSANVMQEGGITVALDG